MENAVAPRPGELVLNKTSRGALSSTKLDQILHNLGVNSLAICGLTTAICVAQTARETADRGFRVVMVQDACTELSEETHHRPPSCPLRERYFSPPGTVLTSYSSRPLVSLSCEAASEGTVPNAVRWAPIQTPIMIPSSRLALPNDKTITICVISGRSKGLAHRLTKPKTSIGNAGSGANIEIDDPQVSSLHCAVGVTEDTVRLCDLDSANGTYVNDERVQATNLEHLSEFCVGSTVLLVTILPKRSRDIR